MNCAMIIPALNPTAQLLSFVAELLEAGAQHIIIINDGSAKQYLPLFEKLAVLPRCTVLTHPRNFGKGRALKTAFAYIAENLPDLDGVVTADADGQHRCEDVMMVARALCPRQKKIILGKRTFRKGETPIRSLLGNRITSRIFEMLYGIYLDDTQTGLRGIPLCALNLALAAKGSRYDYELAFLILAQRQHYSFLQLPITTLYFDNNSGSHYHAVRDGFRVLRSMLAGLSKYFYGSLISAATDVLLFFLFNQFVFSPLLTSVRLFLATLLARIASSLVNFLFNRSIFAGGEGSKASQAVRYYILWLVQMLASYLLVLLFSLFIPSDTVSKVIIDLCLAVFSYQVQLHWVFRSQK